MTTPIETRIEFKSSPRTVYKAILDPANIPRFAPGITRAHVLTNGKGPVGTRVDLTTARNRHLEAVITGEARNRFAAVQDENGIVNEWELTRTARGTLATNRLLGAIPEDRAPTLAREAHAKLHQFRAFVDKE